MFEVISSVPKLCHVLHLVLTLIGSDCGRVDDSSFDFLHLVIIVFRWEGMRVVLASDFLIRLAGVVVYIGVSQP